MTAWLLHGMEVIMLKIITKTFFGKIQAVSSIVIGTIIIITASCAVAPKSGGSNSPNENSPDNDIPAAYSNYIGTNYSFKARSISNLTNTWVNCISYSPYRNGQAPFGGAVPSASQILQDLHILAKNNNWPMLRGYEACPTTELTLRLIASNNIPLKYILCTYVGEDGAQSLEANENNVTNCIRLANQYSDIIAGVIVGNETQDSWALVPVPASNLILMIRRIRSNIPQPVTVADHWYWWYGGDPNGGNAPVIAAEIDFIMAHIYPVMEELINGQPNGVNLDGTGPRICITNALQRTIIEYNAVQNRFPDKYIAIGECGWPTHGLFIYLNQSRTTPGDTCCSNQQTYYKQIISWAQSNNILAFWFEAFDESFKGSQSNVEPHWGLFTTNDQRYAKPAVTNLYPELIDPNGYYD